ncbi:PCMD domain-containing protein [Dysgonomonas sp.]
MKLVKLFLMFFIAGFSFTSCFKDEALNSEADIETCDIPGGVLKMDPRIENDRISMMIKQTADITSLAPEFTLTPGATIEPLSGTVRDFTFPQTYTVTSEDGMWRKVYTVSCTQSSISTKYDFEHSELDNTERYYVFYEVLPNNQKIYFWASGNGGFAIVSGNSQPQDYPTTPYPFGKSGNCLKLETKSTGLLGAISNMRLAAGNLFIGDFKTLSAMEDPLGATRFGVPFDFVPIRLKGYYQYKAGPVFIEKDGTKNPNAKDSFDIYAILYETDEQTKYLTGYDALTNPNLISIARFEDKDKKESNDWTFFDLPFEYLPGKVIDPVKLEQGKYNVSIIFTSSVEGGSFRGAVGSTLLIDEVELVHEDN